jgi:hypothetical protein
MRLAMRSQMNARSRERLVDGFVEAYVDWRETCDWVNDAYRGWTLETGTAAAVMFGLYLAALDAEQEAAEAYARLALRVGKLSWAGEPTAEPLGEPERRIDWP